MSNEEFLVVADLDGATQDARIFLAAPITRGRDRGALRRPHRRRARSCDGARATARAGAAAAAAGRAGARRQAARQARSREGEGGDAGRRAPARAGPALDRRAARLARSASPSCAASTRAGPTCRTRRCWPRSTTGWRRSSTDRARSPGASTSPQRSRRWCRGTGSAQVDSLAPTHIEVPSGSRVPIDYANPPSRPCRCACRRCSASRTRRGLAAARCR